MIAMFTVLLNPKATHAADPDWFPHARVLVQEGQTFRWIRGEPPDRHGLPADTQLVNALPIHLAFSGQDQVLLGHWPLPGQSPRPERWHGPAPSQ
jgi:hypothetical protein